MAHPRKSAAPTAAPDRGRSRALAAVLSFLFPGLGQGYLGDRQATILFGLPALVLVALVALQLRDGVMHAFERLLDPAMAVGALVAIVAFGVWRVLAVVNAGAGGGRTLLSRVTVVILVAVIGLSHGVGAWYAGAIVAADLRIFSGDPLDEIALEALNATAEPSNAPTAAPISNGPPGSPGPGDSTAPTMTPSLPPGYEDVYDDEPIDEGEAVVPGARPDIDVQALKGLDDGLLNTLVVGIDWKPGRDHALTDTMIVVSANTTTGEVFMFSFPRDTADFPIFTGGRFQWRLNTFAKYARNHPELYPDGGMRALADQIGYLLGIPIDYYASLNIPGFARVVDALGGVTIQNQFDLADPGFGDGFFLPAGEHRLDGATALQWVRSRHGPHNSDFARALRQQQMLVALRKEMTRPEHLLNLPSIVEAISQVLSTDFPPSEIEELVSIADRVADEPTGSWVFRYPDWAVHLYASQTGGRSVQFLRLDKIAQLSIDLFGDKSLYSR